MQAELRARLEELHASRFRLVETADVERRRLERNLHDGAQQRLVALSLSLALAQREFGLYPAVIEMLERTRWTSQMHSPSSASSHAASIRRSSPIGA